MAQDVGLLFADISGSTRLYRKLGTDEAERQIERCVKRMERAIDSGKGTLLMPAVDEMIAQFASADDLVAAAIEMQRRIADLPPVSGIRLTIRIGVHFGSAEAGDAGLKGLAADLGRALLHIAGAGQIITCAQTAASLSKVRQESLRALEGMALMTELGECQVYEVVWRESVAEAPTAQPATETIPPLVLPTRLAVRFGGKAYLVDADAPRLTIGRDREAGLRLHGSKASRQHAVIERRESGFFLIDRSSNGTFLNLAGMGEIRVQNEEVALSGQGQIAFGQTTVDGGEEMVSYQLS